MLIQMECKDCDFRPGAATVPAVAAKAALADYMEIGNRHAFTNQGHMIVTLIDGEQKRTTFVMKNVTCDQCFEGIPKGDCDLRDGLIICRRCSGTDPCQCGCQRRRHGITGCSLCSTCIGFVDAEDS